MTLKKNLLLPPDSPVYIGDRPAAEMDLSMICYNASSAEMKHLANIGELPGSRDYSRITWINVSGFGDSESIRQMCELYGIHPLTVEDILHTEQQPKMEIFEKYRFLSIKAIQQESEFLTDQISIIILKNTLITFQEIPGDSFSRIRKRILEDAGEIRRMGTDYLAYSILDAVVDEYSVTLTHLEEDIEKFDERATKTSDDSFIGELQDTKRYLLQIRRAILPVKEIILTISHHGMFFQTDELKPYLQDLNENLNYAITMAESHREWLSNIMDVNLSVLSHQMNKVMKVLAMISTIFIPLTFIAGIYGMNFRKMPELEQNLGYPIVLGGMGLIAAIMIIVFKKRRWF